MQKESAAADFDIAIIGGGINGIGIARDAAGQGLRVLVLEQSDLASGTSSASTKLIHGGLRYLEHYAFRLVHEALAEREVLLRNAPHLIRPMRFVLPHHAGLRPAWVLRLGLFLYDHLGGRKLLPPARRLDLTSEQTGAPLQPQFRAGFEYSDCWVDDARLVIVNAIDAGERGAQIMTRTPCIGAERRGPVWVVRHGGANAAREATARVLINAAGPWVAQVSHDVVRLPTPAPVRLVKGSHIVVPRLFAHDDAYLFQSGDGRVVFAIPYEGEFTLIGTTDEDFTGDPARAHATAEEIAYLCQVASGYFREPISPASVVHTYTGVRPLYDDGASAAKDATRDYVLGLDVADGQPPLLTVFGGKITTYRRLAEAALAKLSPYLGPMRRWTHAAPLPGGDFPWDGAPALVREARRRWPFLSEAHALRLVRAHGTRLSRVLGGDSMEAGGGVIGDTVTEAELRYFVREEWARTPDDVLWRRSKLGLHLSEPDKTAVVELLRREDGATNRG